MKLYTHINFGGNCEEAFRYYEKHLGGEITMIMRVRDLPPGVPGPGGSKEAVIHARMSIAGVELVGNDVPVDHFAPMRSAYLYLNLESPEAAESAFAALSADGDVGISMNETFFATRFAQVRDQFGTLWTILNEKSR
jgi:PhnB protein